MLAETQRPTSWDDLRFFLAVAREGGLAGAARTLGVNQSTVFRRVGQLEEGLGARLFDRQPRGYSLTAVGEEMLSHAARIEDDVLALHRLVQGADRELRGTVRITTVDEVLECVAPHLKRFRDRYPGIDLQVDSEQRVFKLSRREADVAIRPGPQPTEPDVVARKLVALRTAAYASPTYLSERKCPRRLSDLAKHHLIDFHKGHRAAILSTDPKFDARVIYRANSMSGQAIAARGGIGVALLPAFIGDPDPSLQRLFLMPETEDYFLWLLIHADLRQTARVRALVDFLTDAVVADRGLYEGRKSRRHSKQG